MEILILLHIRRMGRKWQAFIILMQHILNDAIDNIVFRHVFIQDAYKKPTEAYTVNI